MLKKTSGMKDLERELIKIPSKDSQKGFFDWYLEYEELKRYFESVYKISRDDKILMVGCGNSSNIFPHSR
jgi:hypothetical protein